MSKFIPTLAEAAKYADYAVVLRESTKPCTFGESEEGPIRIYLTAYRVPSAKQFQVFIRSNATADERADAIATGMRYPSGYWAKWPHLWFKGLRGGKFAMWQSVGRRVDDPLLELELEEFRDRDFDSELALWASEAAS